MNDNEATPIVMDGTGKKVTRKGSGRTKGAFSFVKVKLSDLTKKFADPDQEIIIGRKFAESVGFKDLTSSAVKELTGSIEGKTLETRVAVTAPDLGDDSEES